MRRFEPSKSKFVIPLKKKREQVEQLSQERSQILDRSRDITESFLARRQESRVEEPVEEEKEQPSSSAKK